MIRKIIKKKGRVRSKMASDRRTVFYVEVVMNGKAKKYLVKNAAKVIERYGISEDYLPFVYGELIFYSEQPDVNHVKKFRIKGIDRYPPKEK